MDKKKEGIKGVTDSYREAAPYLGLGIQLAATIVIMVYLGSWLDKYFETNNIFLLICSLFGLGAGLYNFIKTVNNLEKRKKENSKK
jgi:ATP synthase protein I